MGTIELMRWFFGLLLAEALNDGLVHRYKVEKKVIYGYGHHAAQLVLIIVAVLFGAVFGDTYLDTHHGFIPMVKSLWTVKVLWSLIAFIGIRIAFFDFIYNSIAGHKTGTIGKSDFWDVAIQWCMVQLGNLIALILRLFKVNFDSRFILMFYNIFKIALAFVSVIWLDRHVATI